MEKDYTETLIGFAKNWTEAQIIIDEDIRKVDYIYGYRWGIPNEEGGKHEAETDHPA